MAKHKGGITYGVGESVYRAQMSIFSLNNPVSSATKKAETEEKSEKDPGPKGKGKSPEDPEGKQK